MIQRNYWKKQIETALSRSKVVIIAGPRQCGKTTLAREFVDESSANYFDLEDPLSLGRLEEPVTALSLLEGIIVIDEVQLRPDLFPLLRVLVDRPAFNGRFLILGSASGQLLRQSSESLAGRCETILLRGFALNEIGTENIQQHWQRGGFPLSFLAETEDNSLKWRINFAETLLQRDFPMWGVKIAATTLRRFWMMLAHYHGQTWNGAEFARSMGVSEPTVRRYLDLLSDAFMVRQLQPWHANIRKRQLKSPKLYIRDSGLLHQLLGINHQNDLLTHPKIGASWEGYVIEEVIARENMNECWYWGTHQGAEIDLLLKYKNNLHGVEVKRTDTPKITPSIRSALKDLQLESVTIIYPGSKHFKLADNIEALPLDVLIEQGLCSVC